VGKMVKVHKIRVARASFRRLPYALKALTSFVGVDYGYVERQKFNFLIRRFVVDCYRFRVDNNR